MIGIFLIGLILSLLFSANPTTSVMILAMEVHFTYFYMNQTKKFSTPDWELY